MEPDGSLPYPQEPATYLHPEPHQSSLSYFFKIHFNIILPSASRSLQLETIEL
jgi:hypothetical protein